MNIKVSRLQIICSPSGLCQRRHGPGCRSPTPLCRRGPHRPLGPGQRCLCSIIHQNLIFVLAELCQEHGSLWRESGCLHCAVQGQRRSCQGGIADQDHCQVDIDFSSDVICLHLVVLSHPRAQAPVFQPSPPRRQDCCWGELFPVDVYPRPKHVIRRLNFASSGDDKPCPEGRMDEGCEDHGRQVQLDEIGLCKVHQLSALDITWYATT